MGSERNSFDYRQAQGIPEVRVRMQLLEERLKLCAEAESIMSEVLGWLDLFDKFPQAELALLQKLLVTKHGEVSLRMERLAHKYGANLSEVYKD